jgi:hypothetical protein
VLRGDIGPDEVALAPSSCHRGALHSTDDRTTSPNWGVGRVRRGQSGWSAGRRHPSPPSHTGERLVARFSPRPNE